MRDRRANLKSRPLFNFIRMIRWKEMLIEKVHLERPHLDRFRRTFGGHSSSAKVKVLLDVKLSQAMGNLRPMKIALCRCGLRPNISKVSIINVYGKRGGSDVAALWNCLANEFNYVNSQIRNVLIFLSFYYFFFYSAGPNGRWWMMTESHTFAHRLPSKCIKWLLSNQWNMLAECMKSMPFKLDKNFFSRCLLTSFIKRETVGSESTINFEFWRMGNVKRKFCGDTNVALSTLTILKIM